MKRLPLLSGAAVSLVAGSFLAAPGAFADGPLPNGFTAKVVAHSGQVISGTIDATGFDVGVYIGPGVRGVTVAGATVTGADDQGILVQDASDVLIKDSTLRGNAAHRLPQLHEVKAIVLAGTRNVLVSGNTIEGNGDGGVGVYDDGPHSPETFAPIAIDASAVPSAGNVVSGNTIRDNLDGCGIVVSGKNPGGGVTGTVVSFNTVSGVDPAGGDPTPALGGIVVAGGEFGAVEVSHTVVLHNTVTGGFIPGISVHGTAPAAITGTVLVDDVLARNGGNPNSRGVEIAGSPGSISGTQVVHVSVAGDHYGVFHVNDADTHIVALQTSDVAQPVGP